MNNIPEPLIPIYKMKNEIYSLQEKIDEFVDTNGINSTISKLREYLDLSEHDNAKLKYCIGNTLIGKFIPDHLKHSIICCIAKSLEFQNIPHENIYSKNELIEFDPAKEGKNILKHGIHFNEIISYLDDKASLISEQRTKAGEKRVVYFMGLHKKNIVFIAAENKPDSNDLYLDQEIRDKCRPYEQDFANASREEKIEIIRKIMEENKELGKLSNKPKPIRIISARYFGSSEAEIKATIREVIKDGDLDQNAIDGLRDSIQEFLEEYGYKNEP